MMRFISKAIILVYVYHSHVAKQHHLSFKVTQIIVVCVCEGGGVKSHEVPQVRSDVKVRLNDLLYMPVRVHYMR